MSRSRPTLVLLLACVAQFMLLVDDTITNVALPTIGRDLHFSVANLSWVVNAYLLTFGGLLLVGGRLADRFGPRRVFAISLAGFAAASALCGIAPSSGVLVGARALQGIFGALLSPSALALLLAASPAPAERRRALAIWAGLLGLGAATGLLAGGALVQLADWRWIFLINVPVAAAALAAIPRVLAPDDLSARRSLPNVGGAALATLSLLAARLHRRARPTATPGPRRGHSAAWRWRRRSGVAFAVSERRARARPLLPAELLRRPLALRADLVIFFAAAGLLAMFFFQTLYLQRVLGFSPLTTGLSFLPFSGAMGDRLGGDGPAAPAGRPASADHHRLQPGGGGPVADGRPHAHQLLWRRRAAHARPHRPGPRPGLRARHRPGHRRRRGARRRSGLRPDDHRPADRRRDRDRRAHHRGHRSHHRARCTPARTLASALTDGFQAAFHVEAGIIAAAALLALVLLRRPRADRRPVRVGEVVMSSPRSEPVTAAGREDARR